MFVRVPEMVVWHSRCYLQFFRVVPYSSLVYMSCGRIFIYIYFFFACSPGWLTAINCMCSNLSTACKGLTVWNIKAKEWLNVKVSDSLCIITEWVFEIICRHSVLKVCSLLSHCVQETNPRWGMWTFCFLPVVLYFCMQSLSKGTFVYLQNDFRSNRYFGCSCCHGYYWLLLYDTTWAGSLHFTCFLVHAG